MIYFTRQIERHLLNLTKTFPCVVLTGATFPSARPAKRLCQSPLLRNLEPLLPQATASGTSSSARHSARSHFAYPFTARKLRARGPVASPLSFLRYWGSPSPPDTSSSTESFSMMTTPTYRPYLRVRPLQTLSPQSAWSANSPDIPHFFVTVFLFTRPHFSAFGLHQHPKRLLILPHASVRAI